MERQDAGKIRCLKYDEIQEYLRNRYPLLMVDYAPEVVPGKYANGIKNLTQDEWFFQCHFPGDPLVPGVLQLEAIFQTAALSIHTLPGNKEKKSYIARVKDVGYFYYIRPGEIMKIKTQLKTWKHGVGQGGGVIYVDDKIACKAKYTLVIEDDVVRKEG